MNKRDKLIVILALAFSMIVGTLALINYMDRTPPRIDRGIEYTPGPVNLHDVVYRLDGNSRAGNR